jgi:hypothetical protein
MISSYLSAITPLMEWWQGFQHELSAGPIIIYILCLFTADVFDCCSSSLSKKLPE